MRQRRALVAAASLGLVFLWASPGNAKGRVPIGTNLDEPSYWGPELPFVDSFKSASEWVSGSKDEWEDKRRLDLDPRGWVRSLKPGQEAHTVLFAGFSKFPGLLARRYVVTYEGKGRLKYDERAALVEHGDRHDLIAIDDGAEGNATLSLTSTDPRDPLRDIHVTAEGGPAKPGDFFNPVFLDSIKSYRTLRFMDWMLGASHEMKQRRWRDRPTTQDARWSTKGVPVEVMVALANRVHADAWFSMPHAVDDDYIRRFAQVVGKTLDPTLKVYVEYSNEVWNDIFPQARYAREKGLAQGLSKDPFEAQLRYQARRSREIFEIWEQVMGKERLVRVLSTQSSNPQQFDTLLAEGDTRAHVDALAIAPYFGYELANDPKAVANTLKMSLDELLREVENGALPRAKAEMQGAAATARKYGLPLLAYEGGQHLVDIGADQENAALNALFGAANRDPRMGKIYARYLLDWQNAGGGLFLHFLSCGGRFGALEYLTQPRAEAPKFDALHRFMEGK